jgi:tetratricopeptide (TPR) repeat protein
MGGFWSGDMSAGQTGHVPQGLCAKLSRAVSGVARHYEMVGRGKDAVGLIEATLEFAAPDLGPQDRALLMADLGGMIWKQGQYERALALLEEAKGLAQDKLTLATALYHLGEIDFKFAIGRACHVLAELHLSAGHRERALGYFEKLAQLSAQTGYKMFSGVANKRIEEIKS